MGYRTQAYSQSPRLWADVLEYQVQDSEEVG